MKTTLFLLTILLAGSAAAIDSRHSYISEHELQGFGDFNGDGLLDAVVVDRESGNYRVGTQAPSGDLQWGKAQPSGIAGADGIAAGTVASTSKDSLLVAGMFANRVNLLAPDAPFTNPTALALDGVGPISVAALDINFPGNDPARDDLFVITDFNFPDTSRQAVFQSSAVGVSKVSETIVPKPFRRAARVFPAENVAPWLGYLELDDLTNTETFVLGNVQTPAVADFRTLTGLPVGVDYLAAPLRGGNANQLVFWLPGDPILRLSQITAGPTLGTPVEHDLGAAIASVYVQEIPSGIIELLITFDGGARATTFRIDAAGDPVAGQSFTAPTDEVISGALCVSPGQLVMLARPEAGGASTRFQNLTHDGSRWNPSGRSDLPPVGGAAGGTNIFLYDSEPLVNADAKLVQTLHIADWSSALAITGGATPTASIVAETFADPATGLDASTPRGLGSVASGVTFGLPNQLFPQASLSVEGGTLGAAVPGVTATPPPGEYERYITPVLSSEADIIHYRFENQPWGQAAVGEDVTIYPPFRAARPFTLFYYAETAGVRSPITRAEYTFAGEPGSIDTDGDGVPDWIELANGLDPAGGADSDGDGYSDLLEILQGSNPDDANSTPAPGADPIEFGNHFDLALKPLSHDGLPGGGPANASWAASNADHTPTNLRAFSPGGALLGQVPTEIEDRDSLVGPSAFFESLPGNDRDLFVIVGTDTTFDTKPDNDAASGRELLGLVAVPHLATPPITSSVDPLAPDAEITWVTDVTGLFMSQSRPLIEQTLTFHDSLDLLAFEKVLIGLLGQSFSLTGFRDPRPLGEPDLEALLALQTNTAGDSYLLQSVFAEVAVAVDNAPDLQLLAEQLYQISAANGDADPGAYPNPFDVLRAALAGDPLPSSYAGGVTANLAAVAAFSPTLSPRPVTNLTAEVTALGLLDTSGGNALRLYDADGSPFVFPRGIDLPVGTTIEIVAFTDRTTLPAGPGLALETISATLTSIPLPRRQDTDGNLLDDAWQNHYFAGDSAGPFADTDGDGYITLQEMLENTNPTNGASRPTGPRLNADFPPVKIGRAPSGGLLFTIEFPSRYADEVGFALLTGNGNLIRFEEVGAEAEPNGLDTFEIEIPIPTNVKRNMFRFRMFLKR